MNSDMLTSIDDADLDNVAGGVDFGGSLTFGRATVGATGSIDFNGFSLNVNLFGQKFGVAVQNPIKVTVG